MAFQIVRSFFGQRSPSRSRVHEPIIESESFGNQGGKAHYDTRDVGKSANPNWFELARHDKEASELGRKPHSKINSYKLTVTRQYKGCLTVCVITVSIIYAVVLCLHFISGSRSYLS